MPIHYLFDWGNTLMLDDPQATGPMYKWPNPEAMPNAEATLSILSTLAQCHIATNAKDSTAKEIRMALDRVNLGQYITNIFCFREIGVEKPSFEFFERILMKLNCDTTDLLMVGDDLQKDIIGASSCGIPGILFNHADIAVPKEIQSISSLMELIPDNSLTRMRERVD